MSRMPRHVLRHLLALLVALALAWSAGSVLAAPRAGDAPCPSRPAAEALKVCVAPGLPAAPRTTPVQGAACEVAAVVESLVVPGPSGEARPLAYRSADTLRPGISASPNDPPPRAA